MKPLLLIACMILPLAACQKSSDAPSNEASASQGQAPVKGVDRSHKGDPFPDLSIRELDHDADTPGSSFVGAPTLVNLWATWCAPCVKELPSLDALAKQRADIAVVPISQDAAPAASVNAFLDRLKIENVGRYHDPKMAFSGALGPDTVLPTSILYDAEGKEVWRFVGELDWAGPEAAKLLSEARGGAKG